MATLEDKRRTEAAIERTTAALVDKAHRLEHRAVEVKDRVRQTFSPVQQTREHPLEMVGVAFGLGFVLGWRS